MRRAFDVADFQAHTRPTIQFRQIRASCRAGRPRHALATEIRKRLGLEAAQVVLGHSTADVIQIYAERDHDLASKVIKAIG